MRSSNPVLTRLTPENQPGYRTQPPTGYGSGPVETTTTDRMTVDDVVVRTVGLLVLTGVSAALAWTLVPFEYTVATWIGAAMIGLVIGLVISFKRLVSPPLIVAYAVIEGVFVGMVSKAYETAYGGIVMQAVIATFGVFFIMAALYRTRVLRATPRFTKILVGAVAGLFVTMLANFLLSLFHVTTGLRGYADGSVPWWGYAFSIVCIVVAALTFILDFDQIEQGVRAGMEKKFAWYCAFGILVGLIWLYLEILRLLGYLRGDR